MIQLFLTIYVTYLPLKKICCLSLKDVMVFSIFLNQLNCCYALKEIINITLSHRLYHLFTMVFCNIMLVQGHYCILINVIYIYIYKPYWRLVACASKWGAPNTTGRCMFQDFQWFGINNRFFLFLYSFSFHLDFRVRHLKVLEIPFNLLILQI